MFLSENLYLKFVFIFAHVWLNYDVKMKYRRCDDSISGLFLLLLLLYLASPRYCLICIETSTVLRLYVYSCKCFPAHNGLLHCWTMGRNERRCEKVRLAICASSRAQAGLSVRAVSPEPLLFAAWIVQLLKMLQTLHQACEDLAKQSGLACVAHLWRRVFSWPGSYEYCQFSNCNTATQLLNDVEWNVSCPKSRQSGSSFLPCITDANT